VWIGKFRGFCRSRATRRLSDWRPCRVCGVVVGTNDSGESTLRGVNTTLASNVVLGTSHDDKLNLLPPDTEMRSRIRQSGINPSSNQCHDRITRTLKTFYFDDFGFFRSFQPEYKLYEGKNVFLYYYKYASDTRVMCTVT